MPSTSIRIDEQALAALRDLARRQRQSVQSVLKDAVERYRREQLLKEANQAYARLHDDPHAWKEESEDRALWDKTIADGLEQE